MISSCLPPKLRWWPRPPQLSGFPLPWQSSSSLPERSGTQASRLQAPPLLFTSLQSPPRAGKQSRFPGSQPALLPGCRGMFPHREAVPSELLALSCDPFPGDPGCLTSVPVLGGTLGSWPCSGNGVVPCGHSRLLPALQAGTDSRGRELGLCFLSACPVQLVQGLSAGSTRTPKGT